MKIIFSRKGVDSGEKSGRMVSPILPCSCLCSIPIPHPLSTAKYSDISFGRDSLLGICRDLNQGWIDELAHLDPDLRHDALRNRPDGWRGLFGQSGASARHLINQHVQEGSLFLFFGWFRKAIFDGNGRLKFRTDDPNGRHIVFGWMQVGHVIDRTPVSRELRFAENHPHIKYFNCEKPNRIFVAAEDDLGAGLFRSEADALVLTEDGQKRSKWLLEDAFRSVGASFDLTYHRNEKRWGRDGNRITLQSVSRGQEFVLDGSKHPEVEKYARNLIGRARRNRNQCMIHIAHS